MTLTRDELLARDDEICRTINSRDDITQEEYNALIEEKAVIEAALFWSEP